MKEVVVKTYKFNELEESAQRKALEKFADINVDHDWYEFSYEDFEEQLKEIGLKANGFWFSLDRDWFIEMRKPHFLSAATFIEAAIKQSNLKPLKSAVFELVLNEIVIQHESYFRHGKHKITLDSFPCHDRLPRLSKLLLEVEEALNTLLQDKLDTFLSSLQKECEYLMSEESIKETIECNEYDFRENGELFHG